MLNWFSELINAFGELLLTVLPKSPFKPYIELFRGLPYLGWLNWLVPVRACLVIMASWLSAVAIFYLYSIIMRWVKVIGD